MKKEEVKAISFESKILDISLVDFNVEVIEKSKINKNNFAFEFNVKINLNPSKRSVIINSATKIFSDQSKDLYLGVIESVGKFEIINYDAIVKEYSGMPNVILSMFAGVLISTTRGFLLLKSIGTIVEGALFPIVNPNSLFNNPSNSVQDTKKL